MAATAIDIPSTGFKSLYKAGFFLNFASRCNRIRFEDLQLAVGSEITIDWFNCHDAHLGKFASWKEVKSSRGTTTVQTDGSVEFLVCFGSGFETKKKSGVCQLALTRIEGADPKAPPILPTLSYVLNSGADTNFRREGVIPLYALWGEVVHRDAILNFTEFAHSLSDSIIDVGRVKHAMQTIWQQVFSYLLRRQEKTKSKECTDDGDVIPPLSEETLTRIILVATNEKELPKAVSLRHFCGLSATEGVSIWRVFYTLVDVIGRSKFLRRLYSSGQLYLLRSEETVEIHTDKFVEIAQQTVYFFRIPRSIVNEPAVVVELFNVRHEDQTIILEPIRPTSYITSSQIEKSSGVPYTAFAALTSQHHDVLKQLNVKGLIQPPINRIHSVTNDGNHCIKPIDVKAPIEGFDDDWWVSSEIRN